jgi:hypothetical protein
VITIEITAPTHCGTELLPGDRITVARMTPELKKMLTNTRVDGSHVARVVKAGEDDEIADAVGVSESATTGRRRAAVRVQG